MTNLKVKTNFKNENLEISKHEIKRLNEFKSTLAKGNFFDEECLIQIKKDQKFISLKYDLPLCGPIEKLEYYLPYTAFLPHLKNSFDINIQEKTKQLPIVYLRAIYSEAFNYLKINSFIEKFNIKVEFMDTNFDNESKIRYIVSFENNGQLYEDFYYDLDKGFKSCNERLKNDPVSSFGDLSYALLSNKSINYLLVDLNNGKRLITSRLGGNMKLYSMNIKTAKFFDPDIVYANSLKEFENTLKPFEKIGMITKFSKEKRSELILNYRKDNPQILVTPLLIKAGCKNITPINIREFREDNKELWGNLLNKIETSSNGVIKVKDFRIDSKTTKNKIFLEFKINDLFYNEIIETNQNSQKKVSEDILNLLLTKFNNILYSSGISRKFYYDEHFYIYFINDKERNVLNDKDEIFRILNAPKESVPSTAK